MCITILITGVSGGGVGRQCMKALALSNKDYKIITADANPCSLGLFDSVKSYVIPLAKDPGYIESILKICKENNVQVIIPGSEAEMVWLSKNKNILDKNNILLLTNDSLVIELCHNKSKTNEFLESKGFNVPYSYIPKNKNDITDKTKFPVIVKPYKGGGGSKGVFIAQNSEELSFFIDYIMKQGLSPMVQEYIGSPEEEYTVGVISSLKGEILGSIALKRIVKGTLSSRYSIKDHKKDETYVVSSGVSQGIVDNYDDIRECAEKIAKELGSKGPLNIQCRKTDKGIYIFEINPRFSGTTSIRALCGFNGPDTLIRKHLLGEKIEKMNFKKGIILRDLDNFYIDNEEYESFLKNKVKGK